MRRRAERIPNSETSIIQSSSEPAMSSFIDQLQAENERLRQAWLRLNKSRNLYIEFFELCPWGCINMGKDGRIARINRVALELLGLEAKKVEGKRMVDLIYPEDQSKYLRLLTKITVHGESHQRAELRLLKNSNEPWCVQLEIRDVYEVDHFECRQIVFLDIHKWKLLEDEHRRSTDKYASIFLNAGVAMVVFNIISGAILEVNVYACHLYGYALEEMPLLNLADLAVDSGQILQTASMESGTVLFSHHKRKDGTLFPVEISLNCHTQHDQQVGTMAVYDRTRYQQDEQSLRERKAGFRAMAENVREIFWMMNPHQLLYVSPAYEEICGRSRESLYKDPTSCLELIYPEDKERVLEAWQNHVEAMAAFDLGCRIIRPDGVTRWLWIRAFPVLEQGRAVCLVGIAEDITTRKEIETILRLQRHLSERLNLAENLTALMQFLLEGMLQLDSFDAGAIYAFDSESRLLRLICHRGLSSDLVKQTSHFKQASPQVQFALQGQPMYWSRSAGTLGRGKLLQGEEMRSLAAVPVMTNGEPVALMVFGSYNLWEIPVNIRYILESIASNSGINLSRLKLETEIKVQAEGLREVNAALKVMLKQREQDRAELEKSMLDNVRQLVFPYLEKLQKSRLGDEQKLKLDLLASHLREITSPFVTKLSAEFLQLSPNEIRIAELIRSGRTSKEIADILTVSETTVLFHRQNIRKKLALKHKRVNLQSYLQNFSG